MGYKITVVGTGYVGLVTGVCFSHLGNKVICVDNDESKIQLLKKGIVPIYEPGLKELLAECRRKNNISFTSNLSEGVEKGEVIFIAVGTPPLADGSADLSAIENVSRGIARAMKNYKLIVEKSTVPVETGERVSATISRFVRKNIPFDVASNPEFLREGSAVNDFLHPDRIVIGVNSERAAKILKEIYQPLKAPILVTDVKSAELIKHASNSFLAMKISFINGVANICEKVGANVEEVAEGIGLDKRIGRSFLKAGIGFGGFCFPKDLEAFYHISRRLGYDFELLKAVRDINERQKQLFVQKIEDVLWILKGKKIGVLGLAFKPNTDDMRFAPAIDIINALKNKGARIFAYDPVAMEKAKKIIPDIKYGKDVYEVSRDADCLAILTEWQEFRDMDLKKIKKLMHQPIIVDGRNIFEPEKVRREGFIYVSIGRK